MSQRCSGRWVGSAVRVHDYAFENGRDAGSVAKLPPELRLAVAVPRCEDCRSLESLPCGYSGAPHLFEHLCLRVEYSQRQACIPNVERCLRLFLLSWPLARLF